MLGLLLLIILLDFKKRIFRPSSFSPNAASMVLRCLPEAGWVAYVSFGLRARKLVVVVGASSELGFS